MMSAISKVAVIGAGVMGSGIAAHLANAGAEVVLLDIDADLASAGVARQIKSGGFLDPRFSNRVRTGSTASDLDLIRDADWIIEAVAERLDIKRALYERVDAARKPGSIVSSNTSTIPFAALTGALPSCFSRDFLITHFFNPPRHMRLLEVVVGPATRPEAAARVRHFADVHLGKRVILAKDTPGFVANRIGTYWMAVALNEAISAGIDVEEADAVLSKPFGIPSSGVFGLLDLVGIDLMPEVFRSLQQALPPDDPIQAYPAEPPLVARMVAEGRVGRKAGAGFARRSRDGKSREVIDLATGSYRQQRPVLSESLDAARGDPLALMAHSGRGGRYAAEVMQRTLSYAAALVPEIADTPCSIDEAMRLGYGWKEGPFELIDRLGAAQLAEQISARGKSVPMFLAKAAANGGFYCILDKRQTCFVPAGTHRAIERAEGVLSLADKKLAAPAVQSEEMASLWDLGDGVALLEFHSKMNTLNSSLLAVIERAVERVARDFRALVIGGEAASFSAGADLREFLAGIDQGDPGRIGAIIDAGQNAFRAIKFAPFPTVGVAVGHAVGGGCEILLHCSAIQAHAELSIGLVETLIGVIPGWGGCKELLLRLSKDPHRKRGPVVPALAAFDLIRTAKVSGNAFEARSLGFLRESDPITMNRDRLLADAKATALALAENYRAPEPQTLTVSGPSGISTMRSVLDGARDAGTLLPHDRVVGEALIGVLSGGPAAEPTLPVTEDAIPALERAAFLNLVRTEGTRERIRHMLATRKPLRN